MSQSIESFVSKLQAEGVESGRQQARQIVEQAQAEARQLIEHGRRQAEQAIAEANRQHESLLERAHTELKLASRDAVLALRQSLDRAVNAVLAAGAARNLNDPEVVRQILHDLVVQYAQSDIAGRQMDIRVNQALLGRLTDWAIHELHGGDNGRLSIELADGLKSAGFEYSISGSTVEVTVGSVVELLSAMVTPALAEIIRQALAEERGQGSG